MNSDQDAEDIMAELEEIGERLKHAVPQQDNHQVQTVIHQGPGQWGIAAIVACFCTILLMVVVTNILLHENDKLARRIETLEAWMGVNNNTLSELKSDLKHLETKP